MSFHSFRGQRVGKVTESRRFSQDTFRTTVHSYDQHGRKYWFPAEKSTGMPCGVINPCFQAPFELDSHYIVVNPENATECYADFRTCAKDRLIAQRSYFRHALEVAAKKGWPAPALGEYSDELIAAHPDGMPPRAFQLALAAEQGNPWVLGFSTRPDPRLEQYIESWSREDLGQMAGFDYGADSYDKAVADQPSPPPTRQRAFVARTTRPTSGSETDILAALEREAAEEEALIENDTTDFDALAGDTSTATDGAEELDGMDDLDEEPESYRSVEEDEDELRDTAQDEEEHYDPGATGGRTVKPGQEDKLARQAPRRPAQTSQARKRANNPVVVEGERPPRTSRKPWKPDGKKTLADGATPVVG